MYVIDYVILACWVAFWVYWLAASVNAKAAAQGRTGRLVGDRVVLIFVIILLARSGLFKGHSGTVNDPVLQGIGMAVFFMGLALAIWARVCLGTNWGTPMSEKVDAELVMTGPYRRIRNPIYSGIILATIGTSIAVGVFWLVAVVVMGSYFVYSCFVEERIMARLFPETYPQYKQSTKRLIPYIF
ncbi:MAG: methyltransferase family protein [Nitrososphaerales archaeon]